MTKNKTMKSLCPYKSSYPILFALQIFPLVCQYSACPLLVTINICYFLKIFFRLKSWLNVSSRADGDFDSTLTSKGTR